MHRDDAHLLDAVGRYLALAESEMDARARAVGMSASSFHEHFKRITSSSPLQYQKGLRLLEARRLLAAGTATATTAAFEVGYESPTQFSREYTRKFGRPPSKELETGRIAREATIPETGPGARST